MNQQPSAYWLPSHEEWPTQQQLSNQFWGGANPGLQQHSVTAEAPSYEGVDWTTEGSFYGGDGGGSADFSQTGYLPGFEPELVSGGALLQDHHGGGSRDSGAGIYGVDQGQHHHQQYFTPPAPPPPAPPSQVYYDPYDPNLFNNLVTTSTYTYTSSYTSYQSQSFAVPSSSASSSYPTNPMPPPMYPPPQRQPSSSIFDFSTLSPYRPSPSPYANPPPSSSPRLPQYLQTQERRDSTTSSFSSNSQHSQTSQPSPPSAVPSPKASASSSSLPALISAGVTKRAEFLSAPHPLPSNPPRRLGAVDSRRGQQKDSTVPVASTSTSIPCLVLDSNCKTCGEPIARLNMRDLKGKLKERRLLRPQRAVYTCLACSPELEEEITEFQEKEVGVDGDDKDAHSYKDTLSAAIDTLAGLKLEEEAPTDKVRPPPILQPEKCPGDLLLCDVCCRPLGRGFVGPVVDDGSPPEELAMETICVQCDSLYALCSDCGSGGGRLSNGRWRCKEVFATGRRTCRLNHRRNPDMADRVYTVTKVLDIPENEIDNLETQCRKMYFDTRFSGLARPEMLERGDGLVTRFAEVEKTTIDGWNLLSPMLRKENQTSPTMVRYISMQTPKTAKGKPNAGDPNNQQMAPLGFILAEHDLVYGAIFFCFISPWAILGKAADANAINGQTIVARCRADLIVTNKQRELEGLSPCPPLSCVWVMGPFKVDSKFTSSFERKGFRSLAVVKNEWKDVPVEAFPPIREIFIPNQFFKAFSFWIRKFEGEDDVGSPPPSEKTGKRVRIRSRPAGGSRPVSVKPKPVGLV